MIDNAVIRRFEGAVITTSDGTCWDFAKSPNTPYGQFSMSRNGKATHYHAHVVAWMIANRSDVPDGLEVSHLCNNKRCTLAAHLIVETHAENLRRMRENDYPMALGAK